MKCFRFLALALCAFAVLPALAQYPQAWSTFKNLRQPSSEQPLKLLDAPNGGHYVCGDTGGLSAEVVRVDSAGAMLWNRCIPGKASDFAANGTGIAVVGSTFHSPGSGVSVAKFDDSGNLLWLRNAPGTFPFRPAGVEVDAAGDVLLAATVSSQTGPVTLFKFGAAAGDLLFKQSYAQAGASFWALRIDAAGSAYVECGVNDSSSFIVKYDANGVQKWSHNFGTNTFQSVFAVDSLGNSFSVLNVSLNSVRQMQVFKLDTDGNVLSSPATTQIITPTQATITSTGQLVVVGSTNTGMSLTKFASDGTFESTTTKDAYYVDSTGGPQLALDSTGNTYVAVGAGAKTALLKFDAGGNFLWALGNIGDSEYYAGKSLTIDVNGNVSYLCSARNPEPTFYDYRLAKINGVGNILASNDYDTGRSPDTIWGTASDPGGNTYALSFAQFVPAVGVPQFGITKFTNAGGIAWSHGIAPLTGDTLPDIGYYPAVIGPALVPSGGVVFAQTAYVSDANLGVVYRYDANGTLLWTKSFADHPAIEACAGGPDGSVYVAMASITNNVQGIKAALRVVKLDLSGNVLWTVDHPAGQNDYGQSIIVDSGGNAYVNFAVYDGPVQLALAKISSAGVLQWAEPVGDTLDFNPPAQIALDSSGDPLIVAPKQILAGGDNLWLTKLDPLGNVLWSSQALSADPDPYLLSPIVMDSLDNTFIGGEYFPVGGINGVQKFNSSGVALWERQLVSTASPAENGLAPDNAGGVAVAHETRALNGIDVGILKLDANGNLEWPMNGGPYQNGEITYDVGGIDNHLVSLASDTFGNLYMSGNAIGPDGTQDMNVVKYNASNSVFVSLNVASSMSAGETYQATVTFQNTGFNTWTKAPGYKLAVFNSPTWGVSSVYLNSTDAIASGQSKSFKFYVYAPIVGGTYNFQCKMYKNLSSFGSLSTVLPILVIVHPYAARYVTETTPSTVRAGSTFSISVDMRNVGTNTWTLAGGYGLSPVAGNPTWGVTSIPLSAADSIAQGAAKVFTFNCVAPATAGSYTMRWQMHAGATFFGDRTISKTITVTP